VPAVRCSQIRAGGVRCRAYPIRGRDVCFFHDPERAEELAKAQHFGGLRRKKEQTTAIAYDLEGLSSPDDAVRVIQIAILDTLALENSLNRNRTLGYLAQVMLQAVDKGDNVERLSEMEAVITPRVTRMRQR
jgi:hypothetical protein